MAVRSECVDPYIPHACCPRLPFPGPEQGSDCTHFVLTSCTGNRLGPVSHINSHASVTHSMHVRIIGHLCHRSTPFLVALQHAALLARNLACVGALRSCGLSSVVTGGVCQHRATGFNSKRSDQARKAIRTDGCSQSSCMNPCAGSFDTSSAVRPISHPTPVGFLASATTLVSALMGRRGRYSGATHPH